MNEKTTFNQLGVLLVPAIIITIVYGYIPAELTLVRSLLSFVQLGCMAGVVVVALRSVLRDF